MALKSDACEHIASITAGNSGTDNYSFSSIPQTYKHLQVIMSAATTGYESYLLCYFNDDTTMYSYAVAYGDASGEASVLYNGNVTYAYIGWLGAFAGAGAKGNLEMWVPNYTSTTHYKAGLTRMGSKASNYTAAFAGGFHWSEYNSAVTKITFELAHTSGDFMGGAGNAYDTQFDLYGWL